MRIRSIAPCLSSGGALMALAVSGLLMSTTASAAVDCAALKPVAPAQTNALQLNPIAEELAAPSAQVGSGVGFSQLFSDGVTVDLALSRAKQHECRALAAATQPLPTGGAYQPASGDATAWRFDMTQNGKRMTADEFDAWMKARGVRVVQGPPKPAEPVAAAPEPAPAAPAAAPAKKKR
ncbi:MAG: hypothetical protein KF800_01250 [Lysobacter sp.]|nr:hypothetical protein [Lysobacter sp.]